MTTRRASEDTLEIEFLNHASFVLDTGKSRLLVDPWLTGRAFSGGWALEWDNPSSFQLASTADYLWISHPHADHMHLETLRKLCAINPKLIFLGNVNDKIDMCQILAKLPFRRFIPLKEREVFYFDEDTLLYAVPSVVIDQIMAYRYREVFVLNVNDAVMDPDIVKRVLDKAPVFNRQPLDILLVNFSHAGKIFDEAADPETIFSFYRNRVKGFIDCFKPRICIPFASFHLYTGEFARGQNFLRVDPKSLMDIDPCIQIMYPGDTLRYSKSDFSLTKGQPSKVSMESRNYEHPQGVAELREVFLRFALKMKKEFWLNFLLPKSMKVHFKDLGLSVVLDCRQPSMELCPTGVEFDFECYAEVFHSMLASPFGFDAFHVGADYRIIPKAESVKKMKWFVFIGCLLDYSLTPRSLLRGILNLSEWKYLYARREHLMRLFTRGYEVGGIS